MTKHLFNYCPIDLYEDKLRQAGRTLDDYIAALGVDGIEQYVYQREALARPYVKQTVGVHLNYWPYWLDFWLRKTKRIKEYFPTVQARSEYFGQAMSRDEWLAVIRKNICAALTAKPEYFVWHVAESNNEEIFTWQFNYSDREVLSAAADVFNAVADEIPEGVAVLFENLWWPGLRLTDERNVKYFLSRIKRQNVGIMLDTGHLMNTNPRLKDEAEAIDYVCHVVSKLGEQKRLLRGVHLNLSLSGKYRREAPKTAPENPSMQQIWQHVSSIDQHRPFATAKVRQILQLVQPEYVVHELFYNDLDDMQSKVSGQLALCR